MEIIGDFKTSVRKALGEINPEYAKLPGLVICGTHAPSEDDMHKQIKLLKEARENGTPTLGICWGMQVMAIEYARNELGVREATSEEIDPDSIVAMVVKLMDLRVGIRQVDGVNESHWHHYKVQDIPQLYTGFEIVKTDDIIEKMRLKDAPFYVGVQFHPEYQSSKSHPHPLLVDFLNVCKSA